MSDNEKENENGQDEGSINVFEDNAYMFGDEPSDNNLEEQNELNDEEQVDEKEEKNENKKSNENLNLNEDINNLESKDSLRKYLEQQMNKDQLQNLENNNNNNDNNNINNDNNKITSNENNNSKKEELKDNIKNFEKNKNYPPDAYVGDEMGEEIENGEMEDIEGEAEGEDEGENENENENEGEEGEETIPLVTLKFISICQFCKNNFNSTIHLPYLLKCGHFFCLKCINETFTDQEGIKCPNDGLVALSVKELKLLNNLITDKSISTQRDKQNEDNIDSINNGNGPMNKLDEKTTCKIHKGQKLTHIITETKQLVCVYCAFDVVRKNPKCEVKEIKEKFDEFIVDADKIINLNQNNIKIIQDSLKEIKKNKEIEEKNINLYFDHIFKYLSSKKAEYLSQIESFFTDNAKKLKNKLEIFSEQIEQGEALKGLIDNYEQNNNFDDVMETYIKLEEIKKNEKDTQISLQEYKFSHDDETKIMKYINNFGDIKTINKYINFQTDKKDIFHLKVSSNVAPLVPDTRKNFFNFNTNPRLNDSNNNKNSSRFNNSNDNQDLENEYENTHFSNINNNNNNKKQTNYGNNYNFNFNKINPMTNNMNCNTGKRSIRPNLGNNNFIRHTTNNDEVNNGNYNYINIDSNSRDNKNYSFNNISSSNKNRGNKLISLQDNNFIANKGSNEGRGINTNYYNVNYMKRNDKDNNINLNKNILHNKNNKNEYGNKTQGSLGYEYKGFKTFNFK